MGLTRAPMYVCAFALHFSLSPVGATIPAHESLARFCILLHQFFLPCPALLNPAPSFSDAV